MPRKAAVYVFEGREMTIPEIHALVPAVSKARLKAHILAGRVTQSAVLNYRHKSTRHVSTSWATINRVGTPNG